LTTTTSGGHKEVNNLGVVKRKSGYPIKYAPGAVVGSLGWDKCVF